MIELSLNHQDLTIKAPRIVAGTINYLSVSVVEETSDWYGLEKHVFFKDPDNTVYEFVAQNGHIAENDQLNLYAGKWQVYVVGYKYDGGSLIQKITTGSIGLPVAEAPQESGQSQLPAGTSSAIEQIAEIARSVRADADAGLFKGDKGDAAFTCAVGETTTAEPGTPASVHNSGTTSDLLLDFTIPKGEKGDKGDTGNVSSADDMTVNGVLDITPRRCYETLSSAGWYRVCAISFNSYNEAIGALGGVLRFAISDSYSNYPNDAHTIDLLLAHNKVTFVAEQSVANGYLEIDKIRYTCTGTEPYNGYVDIHFMGLGGTTYVGISFDYTVVGLDRQARAVAQNLQSVTASPSGETVVTEYAFTANTVYHDDNVTSGVRHIVDRRGDIVTVTIESDGGGINCPAGQYTTVYTLPSELSPAGSVYTVVDAYGGNNIISGFIDTSGNVQLYPVLQSTSYYRFTLTYAIY